jgi:hypothetical protein
MVAVSGRASDLAGWVGKVADGVAGGIAEAAGRLLGGGPSGPADGPLLPARLPAAPPPPAPVPAGGSYSSGGSASGGPNASSDDHDGPSQEHQFGVLDPFSFSLSRGGGRTWLSREPLTPSSAARPPNDRPG